MPGDFAAFEAKMRAEGLPPVAIRTFAHYYQQLVDGADGVLPEDEIEALRDVPESGHLECSDAGQRALAQCVVLKLNGGLGTSMGMTRAKSLVPVKPGLCFLDVIARQVLHLRQRFAARLPLVLMNSFRTRDDSLAALARHTDLASDLPADFLQHKVPRIRADDLSPVAWPKQPDYEWCPPGHGDLYTALLTSGMLDRMREQGYRYAFVSNADNLGAVLDLGILGWFAESAAPFALEVCRRTDADRKGGHLARRRDGRLTLRESAQCRAEDEASFQDVGRHPFFNTNNLWLDLEALERRLAEGEGVLGLPMIRNEKSVDPADPDSPRVIQLETAMGAAVSVFEGATALQVPRERFAPVKTSSDLLALWSDAYRLDEAQRMLPAPERGGADLVIDLDPSYYRSVADLELRFPEGAPSLVACRRLTVRGDVRFGRDVRCRGEVELVQQGAAPKQVPDGSQLEGRV